MISVRFIQLISQLRAWQLSLISIILTMLFTCGFSLFFHGRITYDYLITGFLVSLLVSYSIVKILSIYQNTLRKSEKKYRDIFENILDGIYILDTEGHFKEVNNALLSILGYSRDELLKSKIQDFIHPEDREKSAQYHRKLVEKVSYKSYEGRIINKEGEILYVEINSNAIIENSKMIGSRDILRDITKRKKAEEKLYLAVSVIENLAEGIAIADSEMVIQSVNPSFTVITGFTVEEVIGQKSRFLQSERHGDQFYKDMWDAISETGHWEGEILDRRKSGEVYPQWLSIVVIKNELGKITQYVGVFSDITNRKKYEDFIRHQAYHDPLTGLPNRQLFHDRLSVSLVQAARNKELLAVMFLDLDHFKRVNDTMGHNIGDKLLQLVAKSIKQCVRKGDTVSRLGGDEFTLLLPEIKEIESVFKIAQKVINLFSKPMIIDHHRLPITTSIGISLFPNDGDEPETLLRKADDAMYAVKQNGRNGYQLYAANIQSIKNR